MIVYNRYIPFKRFYAINLFGIIFTRKGNRLSPVALNHERIHTAQMRELLFFGFYLWYLVEWLVLFCKYRKSYQAYRHISFEREAYAHEHDLHYLRRRRCFSQLRKQ